MPQVVRAVTDVLVAPEDPAAVLAAMSDPAVRLVTLTITEKGYCRGAGGAGLDLSHPDIRHDLHHEMPRSAIGFLVRALQRRRAAGLRPFTALSLDNLPANGRVLRACVLDLAQALDPELAQWIAQEGQFPCSMVDRIVPALRPEDVARLRDQTGLNDPAAVIHEPFRQWVIEDRFVDQARPDLAVAGALMVADVAPYEHMKLRMLNGTHSALAYLGQLCGHETVYDASGDPALADVLQRLWRDELAASLVAPAGVDPGAYAAALMARYRNPEIRHLLRQIAMDGSQKLPQRILAPLFENRAAGRPHRALIAVLAGWITYLRTTPADQIDDPLAAQLVSAVQGDKTCAEQVHAVLAIAPIFGGFPADDLTPDLIACLDMAQSQGIATLLKVCRT